MAWPCQSCRALFCFCFRHCTETEAALKSPAESNTRRSFSANPWTLHRNGLGWCAELQLWSSYQGDLLNTVKFTKVNAAGFGRRDNREVSLARDTTTVARKAWEGGTGAEVGTAGTLGERNTAAGLPKGFRGVQAAVDKSNRYWGKRD